MHIMQHYTPTKQNTNKAYPKQEQHKHDTTTKNVIKNTKSPGILPDICRIFISNLNFFHSLVTYSPQQKT